MPSRLERRDALAKGEAAPGTQAIPKIEGSGRARRGRYVHYVIVTALLGLLLMLWGRARRAPIASGDVEQGVSEQPYAAPPATLSAMGAR